MTRKLIANIQYIFREVAIMSECISLIFDDVGLQSPLNNRSPDVCRKTSKMLLSFSDTRPLPDKRSRSKGQRSTWSRSHGKCSPIAKISVPYGKSGSPIVETSVAESLNLYSGALGLRVS